MRILKLGSLLLNLPNMYRADLSCTFTHLQDEALYLPPDGLVMRRFRRQRQGKWGGCLLEGDTHGCPWECYGTQENTGKVCTVSWVISLSQRIQSFLVIFNTANDLKWLKLVHLHKIVPFFFWQQYQQLSLAKRCGRKLISFRVLWQMMNNLFCTR